MWSNKYIGIPYINNGRDTAGLDCWGLARLVYKQEFGIELPSFSEDYSGDDTARHQELILQQKENWEPLEAPVEGCLVLFRILGSESHIGIVTPDTTKFLHVRDNTTSTVESLSAAVWHSRIVGYYKYTEKASAQLVAVPHPLRTERITTSVLPGTTIAQLDAWIAKEYSISDKLKKSIAIMINGHVVPKDTWDTTIIQDLDTVEYRAIPGKEAARMVLMVVVAVYAPYIANYMMGGVITTSAFEAGGMAAAGTGIAAKLTAGMLVAGINLVGGALINSIAPIRPPTLADPADPGSAERQLLVTGAANRTNPYGEIPVILGKLRVTPPLGATNELIITGTADNYLKMLLVWGYGPLQIYQDTLSIGNTPLNSYSNVEVQTLGGINDTFQDENYFNKIYGRDVSQQLPSIELTCPGRPALESDTVTPPGGYGYSYVLKQEYLNSITPGPWVNVTLADVGETDPVSGEIYPITDIEITINFPQGLRHILKKGQNAGSNRVNVVGFEIQYKKQSDATWSVWPAYYSGYPVEGVTVGAVQSYGVYYGVDPVAVTFPFYKAKGEPISTEPVLIRIRRVSGDDTEYYSDYQSIHTAVLQSVKSYRNIKPVKAPNGCVIAKTALNIKASNQLSNQIEGVNAVVQTWCKTWNGTSWINGVTNNPADLFRYVLEHPGNMQKITSAEVADKLDLQQIQYWHSYCTTKGFTYNGAIAGARSLLEVLRDICAAGRASPALKDGKWTVTIDEPKPIIVQHFTPHNSWGFESTKVLPKLPDGLRVTYIDEDQDYQEAEIIVYNVGKSRFNAELFESISLPGVTKSSLVIDHAKWHMAQAKLRPEIYTFNADLEHLVCNRGDRVKVTHDVPSWGLGSGRIKNKLSSTIFELDEFIDIDTVTAYTIRVRSVTGGSITRTLLKSVSNLTSYYVNAGSATITFSEAHPFSVGDNVVVITNKTAINGTVQITAVTSSSITFATTSTNASGTLTGTISFTAGSYSKVVFNESVTDAQVAPGDLFMFGTLDKESQDLLIISIEPTSSKTAKLTLVDYGVTDTYNIFTDYTNLSAATVFETQISLPSQALISKYTSNQVPSIVSIISNDIVVETISPGTYNYRIMLSLANPSTKLPIGVSGIMCEYTLTSDTTNVNTKSVVVSYKETSLYINGVVAGETYKIRVRYTSNDGTVSPWGTWVEHTVIGKELNNAEINFLNVTQTSKYININLITSFIPKDFKYYEVRVFKDSGTGDFWNSTDPEIKVFTTTGSLSVDLTQFSKPRISTAGTQYRIAARLVDTVGNVSLTSKLAYVTITKLI